MALFYFITELSLKKKQNTKLWKSGLIKIWLLISEKIPLGPKNKISYFTV